MDFLPISIRGYQGHEPDMKRLPIKPLQLSDTWYLVFDTETFTDAAQHIRFGVCMVYERLKNGKFKLKKNYLFYDPMSLLESEIAILEHVAKKKKFEIVDMQTFNETIFLPWVTVYHAFCIGFNLPFDISRIALDATTCQSGSMKGGFNFRLSDTENAPGIKIKQINTRAALYQIAYSHRDYARIKGDDRPYNTKYRGRFIDVATIAHVLYSRKFSLDSLCQHLKIDQDKAKQDSHGHGKHLNAEYVEYAINDVIATFECFCKLHKKYAQYNLSTPIERLLTEASLGKASLAEMNIKGLLACQPDLDSEMIGKILSSFYGGRSEIHLRRKILKTLYCDMLSMYPTVNVLMNIWSFVIAKGIKYKDDTENVQKFLASLLPIEKGLGIIQNKKTWRKFHVLCKVIPNDDVFPVRSKYAGMDGDENIGLNYLTCSEPLYFMLPDVIVSTLMTGRVPHVVEAIRFSPQSTQKGLTPINLLGKEEYKIDPYQDDMFRELIELRTNVAKVAKDSNKELAKHASDPKEKDRYLLEADIADSEQLGLKITCNATGYGIFAEIIASSFEELQKVDVYSNKMYKDLETTHRETPGKFFHPLLASLITSASRLLLGIAEIQAKLHGLTWSYCDTDSLGLCDDQNKEDDDFVAAAEKVQNWFDALNPYDFTDKGIKLFKFEDQNYINKKVVPLQTFCISSKRYVLWHDQVDGTRKIEKASVHGLGTYLPPYAGYKTLDKLTAEENIHVNQEKDLSYNGSTQVVCVSPFKDMVPPISFKDLGGLGIARWEYDLWHCILNCEAEGKPFNPQLYDAFTIPVRKQYSNSSEHLLNYYRLFNAGREYRDQVKPFGFYTASSVVDNPFWHEIASEYSPDAMQSRWKYMLSIARKLGGIREEGIDHFLYKKLPRSIKRTTGVTFEELCTALEGKRIKGKVDIVKWAHVIDVAYTTYQIGKDLESDQTKIGVFHPIALYDSEATANTQHWIDRDTGEEIDPSLLTTYADFLTDYDNHAENKFNYGATGDRGFTERRHIKASAIRIKGKEYATEYDALATEGEVKLGVDYKNETEVTEDFMQAAKALKRSQVDSLSPATVSKLRNGKQVSQKSIDAIHSELEKLKETIDDKSTALEKLKETIADKGMNHVARQIGIDKAVLSKVASGKRLMSDNVYARVNTFLNS